MLAPLVALVVVAITVLVIVRPWSLPKDDEVLADGARVSASTTAPGYEATAAVRLPDGTPRQGWRSDDQTFGAWLAIRWQEPHRIHSITIERPNGAAPNVTAGTLSFGDGSALQVMLSARSRTTTVPITPRMVRSIRFTASGFAAGATATAIGKFVVNASETAAVRDAHGDAGATAEVAASSGSDASGLVSGGSGWTTDSADGSTIRFAWPEPRELVSFSLAGATGSKATISSATLQFEGGGSVPIGAVPANSALPTTVAFLPRVVRSATLVINTVAGAGPLTLAAVGLSEQGSPKSAEADTHGLTVEAPIATSCEGVAAPASTTTVQVLCPENGSRVGDSTTLLVAVPTGATSLTVDVWPASGTASVPTTHVNGTGVARVPLQVDHLPDGPITVRIVTNGVQEQTVLFQLVHGQEKTKAAATSSAARGRTLVYDEEFDGPVSASRSGEGTRYTAGKPETGSVTDFGSAIFADPALGLGNLGTLDDSYLRLGVSPKPADYADPLGWNRTSVGGMLASARPGGSGFSAQYGYFEARMLAPAAPGTWPAFWLLPSDNLVGPQNPVAELDAVELYGHDPQGACQSTHEYLDGKDGGVAACGQRFASARSASQWHTYGVDVTPTEVVFYVDGRRVVTSPQVRGGEKPMFFLVDLALGGGWPIKLSGTQGRAQLLVDSIRVYV